MIAEAVRRGEIAPLARGLPLGYERFDFGVAKGRGIRSKAQRAEFFTVIIMKDGKIYKNTLTK